MNWKLFGLNTLQSIVLNMALGSFGSFVHQWPQERLNGWLVRFGRAFGPPGLRHFSELSEDEKQALLTRVPVLNTNHSDFLKPFQWIPRSLTVWLGPAPTMANVIMGNVTPPLKPIPKPGEFYILRGYMASTTTEGVHNRLGWRYDDVQDYHELSVSVKTIKS